MGIAVGIDLGTTNSCVAVVQGNRARVLEDRAGRRIHPSILSFLPNGDVTAGHAAKNRLLVDPENTICSSKRLIGRNLASPETQRLLKELPYKVTAGPDGIPVVSVRDRKISLPEISALILQHLKAMCLEMLGVDIDEAVITAPANFDDVQRSSTKVAGRIAGFEVLRIINEPTAAALAYGFGGKRTERIAVYDFGGGTFDITIVELSDDVFEVLSTAGDTCLGGEDFDKVVMGEMLREFKKANKMDLVEDPSAMQRLRIAAERVKCQLSTLGNVQATLQNIAVSSKGNKLDLFFKLARTRFEELVRPLVDRSFDVCSEALKIAGLKATDLNNLIMVGGTTRMPLVRKRAAEVFGIVPRMEINPDEVVAIGAAIQAFSLTGEQLPEVLPRRSGPTDTAPPAPIKKPVASESMELDVKRQQKPAAPESLELDVKRAGLKDPVLDAKRQKTPALPDLDLDVKRQKTPALPDLDLDVKRQKTPVGLPLALGVKRPSLLDFDLDVDLELDVKRPSLSDLELDVKRPSLSDLELDVKRPSLPDLELDVKRPSLSDLELDVKRPPLPDLELDIKHCDTDSVDVRIDNGEPSEKSVPAEILFADMEDEISFESAQPQIPIVEDEVGAVPGTETLSLNPPSGHTESPASVEVTNAARARSALLLDVSPRALGLAVAGGFCDIVIERNAAIPVEQSRLFTTSTDNQTEVSIDIYQGESRRTEDNTKLGHILLSNLRPAPRGTIKIRVTFEIDTDGMLGVSARNEESKEAESTKIVLTGGMDEEKVKALVRRYSAK